MRFFHGDIENDPPFHTDEFGVRYWFDETTTNDAIRKGFPKHQVWFVKEANGDLTRVVAHNGEVVYENQSLEAVACFFEIMKLDKEME